MRVEVGFAEAGKMFAAAKDSGVGQSSEEFAGVNDDLLGIGGNGSRTHHRARGFKCQVERGSEVDVETKRAAVGPDDASMLAVEFTASGGKYFRWGRRGTENLAETVDRSTFEVNAGEQRRRNVFLASAKQAMRLIGAGDVAGKENYACRLDAFEQGSEARRHLSAVEADDQELADVCCDSQLRQQIRFKSASRPRPCAKKRKGHTTERPGMHLKWRELRVATA